MTEQEKLILSKHVTEIWLNPWPGKRKDIDAHKYSGHIRIPVMVEGVIGSYTVDSKGKILYHTIPWEVGDGKVEWRDYHEPLDRDDLPFDPEKIESSAIEVRTETGIGTSSYYTIKLKYGDCEETYYDNRASAVYNLFEKVTGHKFFNFEQFI